MKRKKAMMSMRFYSICILLYKINTAPTSTIFISQPNDNMKTTQPYHFLSVVFKKMDCKLVLAILSLIISKTEQHFCEIALKRHINDPLILDINGTVLESKSDTIVIPVNTDFLISCAPTNLENSNETYLIQKCAKNEATLNFTCTKPVIRQASISDIVCEGYGQTAIVLSYWNPVVKQDVALAGVCFNNSQPTGVIAFRFDFIVTDFMKEVYNWTLQDPQFTASNNTPLFNEHFLGNTQWHSIIHLQLNRLVQPVGDQWNSLQIDIGNYSQRLLLSIQMKSTFSISVLDTVNDTLHEFTLSTGDYDGKLTSNCSEIKWLMKVNTMQHNLVCSQKLRVGKTRVADIIENIKEFMKLFTNIQP